MANEGTYEVEDIVDERTGEGGKQEFRVRWRSYGEADDTWEPRENLDEFCDLMIDQMRKRKVEARMDPNDTTASSSSDGMAKSDYTVSPEIRQMHSGRGKTGRRGRGSRTTPTPTKSPSEEADQSLSSQRKCHWEHQTLEVLTPEAWNKYGDLEKREISNLYIPDRIPTETEKILCEFDPKVGRVTRNQLKAMRATQIKTEPGTQIKKEPIESEPSASNKKGSSRRQKKSMIGDDGSRDDSLQPVFSAFSFAKAEEGSGKKLHPLIMQEGGDAPQENLAAVEVKIEASDEALLSAYNRVREASMASESVSTESVEGVSKRGRRGRPRGARKRGGLTISDLSAEVSRESFGNDEHTSKAASVRGRPATRGRGRGRRGVFLTREVLRHDEDVIENNGFEDLDGTDHMEVESQATPKKKKSRKRKIATVEDSEALEAIDDNLNVNGESSGVSARAASDHSSDSEIMISGEAETSFSATETAYNSYAVENRRGSGSNLRTSRRRGNAQRGGPSRRKRPNISDSPEINGIDSLSPRKIGRGRGRRRGKLISAESLDSLVGRQALKDKRDSAPASNGVENSSDSEDRNQQSQRSPEGEAEVANSEAATNVLETTNSSIAEVGGISDAEVNEMEQSTNDIGAAVVEQEDALEKVAEEEEEQAGNPLATSKELPMPKASENVTLNDIIARFASMKPADLVAPAQTMADLRSAIFQGEVSLVKSSLRHHMWRNTGSQLNDKRFGKTIVMEVCEKACDDAHDLDDMLRFLVHAGARLDIADDYRGRTALHWAVANEQWCRIRILLSLRSPVNIKDKEGKTPLQIVIGSRSNFHVVRTIYLLLEYGADVNEIIEKHQKNRFVSRLIEYREKLTKYFEEARQKVLIDMTVKRTITPVIVRGVWEISGPRRIINLEFKHESCYLPNVRYMYIVVFALFDYRGPRLWKMRMWGGSPFDQVMLNGSMAQSLQSEHNGFIYAAKLRNGCNQLQIQMKEETTLKKLMLLTQVLLVQLHKPNVIIAPPPLELAPESGTDWRKD